MRTLVPSVGAVFTSALFSAVPVTIISQDLAPTEGHRPGGVTSNTGLVFCTQVCNVNTFRIACILNCGGTLNMCQYVS